MLSVTENQNFKLENVALWYNCRECKRCYHSLSALEKHFMEQHAEKDFILPNNLPPGAKDGKIYLKTSSQKEKKLVQRDFASLIEQTDAEFPKTLKDNAINCEICKKSFKSQSTLNFHTKQHQETNAAGLETAKPLEENSSTANGNKTAGKLAPIATQVVGKRQRILSAKGKAVAIAAMKMKIKGNVVTRNAKSSSTTTTSNYILINNGGKKYRGCMKCPFRTHIHYLSHFERHVKLHQEGSKAVTCIHCGWYVHPVGIGFHIFNSHLKKQRKN